MSTVLFLVLAVLVAGGSAFAQPPKGSQLPLEENHCVTCHGEADLWEGDTLRLLVPHESLAEDVHWKAGVNCHDCHGGNPTSFDVSVAHSTVVADGESKFAAFRFPLSVVKKSCSNCHKDPTVSIRKSVHDKAGAKDESGRGTALECGQCHGEKAHGILPVDDSRSPVSLAHQVETCGGCHEKDWKTYVQGVHGQSLGTPKAGTPKAGTPKTASCVSCHGSHGVYRAADQRSTLYPSNVAATCAKCHPLEEERLQESVHGRGKGAGAAAERVAPGGTIQQHPTCTSCHQKHDLTEPKSDTFRHDLPHRCGNCHPDLFGRYAMSLHGELTRLGYEPAAECADCHGAHDILPVGDPRSRLAAGKNRIATCKQCHPHAVRNFSDFDPHANHHDAKNYPLLYFADHGLHALFYFFFGFFVVHGFLWFVRSLADTLRRGGHKTLITEQSVLIRFDLVDRTLYSVLLISFLGLVLTGLPLKYGFQQWAQSLAHGLGGFQSTSVLHRFFAVAAILGCTSHLVWAGTKIRKLRREKIGWKTILFGPDSPVPTLGDFKVLFGMVRWFLGLGRRPVFERWAYWEKFDYWAVYLAAGVIGTSGLMLWFPNVFCTVLPGVALNVAKVVHTEVAILAASFLFIFHFYHSHFRPEKFPLDLSALTGLVSEEHLKKYRPEYVERLRRTGKLDAIRRPAPSRRRLWFVFLAGSLVYLLGVGLLALVLLATLGK